MRGREGERERGRKGGGGKGDRGIETEEWREGMGGKEGERERERGRGREGWRDEGRDGTQPPARHTLKSPFAPSFWYMMRSVPHIEVYSLFVGLAPPLRWLPSPSSTNPSVCILRLTRSRGYVDDCATRPATAPEAILAARGVCNDDVSKCLAATAAEKAGMVKRARA